jgi:Tfp pilus assembly protein PilW
VVSAPSRHRAPAGLTLVELLVGLAIALVVVGALAALAQTTLGTWRRTHAATTATEEALSALDQMVRDLRQAGYDPRRRAAAGLGPFAADQVTLTADLDGDGRIDTRSREHVSYRRAGRSGDLIRVLGRQAMPLLTGLAADGLRLAYYDAAGAEIAPGDAGAADAVRVVVVTLVTRPTEGRAAVRVTGGARLLSR